MRELQEILKRYGPWALLKHGDEEKKIRVFFQPERSREEDIPGAVTSIGWVDSRLWSCIGTEPVEPGDVLVLDGTAYRVRSSRAYRLGNAVHHWWASLEREREAAT